MTEKEINAIIEQRDRYYAEAEALTQHINSLLKLRKERPEPKELASIDMRLQVLREERRDLMHTALQLTRLALPAPENPSLAARMRDAS